MFSAVAKISRYSSIYLQGLDRLKYRSGVYSKKEDLLRAHFDDVRVDVVALKVEVGVVGEQVNKADERQLPQALPFFCATKSICDEHAQGGPVRMMMGSPSGNLRRARANWRTASLRSSSGSCATRKRTMLNRAATPCSMRPCRKYVRSFRRKLSRTSKV